MNIEDLKKIILEMGNGRLGAFGEYILVRILEEKSHVVSGRHGDLRLLC